MRSLRAPVQPQADPSDVLGEVPASPRATHAATPILGVVRRAPKRGDSQSGAPSRWAISDHAVDRYRKRCPGKHGISLEEAVTELRDLSAGAHYVKTLESGLELWRGGKPWRLRYRVERCHNGIRLVTVLRGCDTLPHGKRHQR